MKETYISKNFKPASLETIAKANEIIGEYAADDMSLTLRQLYYQFVARGFIPNKQTEYKKLGSLISDARLAGMIDWNAIEDRTRNLIGNSHWTDPGQIVRAAANSFRMDHWAGQPYKVEVWIEKEALVGVIADICRDLDVDYFACKGYVSQSELWRAARRMKWAQDDGQQPVIVHLGDHDPSGIDMTRDVFARHDLFGASTIVNRIALNMDQVEAHSPPPNPAKLTDTRATAYIEKYGDESWELDALEPRTLRGLIEETVLGYRDEGIYQDVKRQELEYKEILKHVEDNWETLRP